MQEDIQYLARLAELKRILKQKDPNYPTNRIEREDYARKQLDYIIEQEQISIEKFRNMPTIPVQSKSTENKIEELNYILVDSLLTPPSERSKIAAIDARRLMKQIHNELYNAKIEDRVIGTNYEMEQQYIRKAQKDAKDVMEYE